MHFPAVLAFDKNYVLLASFFLPELPAGKHSIDFGIEERLYNYSGEPPSDIPFQRYTTEGFLYPNYVASWVNTVHFTVDSSDSVFNITMLSIDNRTYNTMNIPLNFSIDKPAEWIAYTLDGKENVTIYGNTTLRDLPNGLHNNDLCGGQIW
ncbi:MAG: hypothetical protein NWE95_08990 [Candidatus Bathyarchaeota archaeon]|nr:hypothetical protein [Candidatus Bathyarchaeota archaeon]